MARMLQWRAVQTMTLRKEETRHEENHIGSCSRTYGCSGTARDFTSRSRCQHRLVERVSVSRHFPRRLVGVRGYRLHERKRLLPRHLGCGRRSRASKPTCTSATRAARTSPTRSATRATTTPTISTASTTKSISESATGSSRSMWRSAATIVGSAPTLDYTFTSVTMAPEKWPYFKIGSFGDDFDGDYFEMGYTMSVGGDDGVDLTFALVQSDDLDVNNPDDGDEAMATLRSRSRSRRPSASGESDRIKKRKRP